MLLQKISLLELSELKRHGCPDTPLYAINEHYFRGLLSFSELNTTDSLIQFEMLYYLITKNAKNNGVHKLYFEISKRLVILYKLSKKTENAKIVQSFNVDLFKILYEKDSQEYSESYADALITLSDLMLELNHSKEAITLIKKSLTIQESDKAYNSLAICYAKLNQYKDAISLLENNKESKENDFTYYNNLSQFYVGIDNQIASFYQNKSLEIVEKRFKEDPNDNVKDYIRMLDNYATCLYGKSKFDLGKKYEKKAYSLIEPYYDKEPDFWAEDMVLITESLAEFNFVTQKFTEALQLQKNAFMIVNKFYSSNKEVWKKRYYRSIEKLDKFYKHFNQVDEILELEICALKELEVDYNKNPDYWIENYSNLLNNLASSYMLTNNLHKAKNILGILEPLQRKLFHADELRWTEDYVIVLNTIAHYYLRTSNLKQADLYMEKGYKILEKKFYKNINQWNNLFYKIFHEVLQYYQLSQRSKKNLSRIKKILDHYEVYLKDHEQYHLNYFEILIIYVEMLVKITNYAEVKQVIILYSLKIQEYEFRKKTNLSTLLAKWDKLVKSNQQETELKGKISRNNSCPCGSGKKYKKCCGKR